MRKTKLCFLLIIICSYAYSQQIVRQSINSLGSSNVTDGMILKQTVGQSGNTMKFYDESGTLRQGFQQPVKVAGIIIPGKPEIEISIFPSPFIDHFSILINGDVRNCKAAITDVTGRIISLINLETNSEQQISCSEWLPGMYLINIVNSNDEIISSTQKVIKTQ